MLFSIFTKNIFKNIFFTIFCSTPIGSKVGVRQHWHLRIANRLILLFEHVLHSEPLFFLAILEFIIYSISYLQNYAYRLVSVQIMLWIFNLSVNLLFLHIRFARIEIIIKNISRTKLATISYVVIAENTLMLSRNLTL